MSENNNENKIVAFFKKAFKVGTPECAIFFAAVAMVVAILILTVGLWKTLLVALFIGLGLFIGGVSDKKDKLRNLINTLFPARKPETYDREAFLKEMSEDVRAEAARTVNTAGNAGEQVRETAEEIKEEIVE